MIVDVGTGDGRAVLARAADDPAALVIGVDAIAASMAEASRRADRRGPSNALFLAAGVETLPASPLTGSADLVTVTFPGGSLLRGVLGLDERALCGVASVARPAARIEVLTSVIPSDAIPGIERLDASWCPGIEAATASTPITSAAGSSAARASTARPSPVPTSTITRSARAIRSRT